MTSAGGGAGGGGEDRHGNSVPGAASGARQGSVTPTGGSGGVGASTKQRGAGVGGEDEDGGRAVEEGRGGRGWRNRESGDQRLMDGGRLGDDDYSKMLKIKAAQALFRMSLEPGGEVIEGFRGRSGSFIKAD